MLKRIKNFNNKINNILTIVQDLNKDSDSLRKQNQVLENENSLIREELKNLQDQVKLMSNEIEKNNKRHDEFACQIANKQSEIKKQISSFGTLEEKFRYFNPELSNLLETSNKKVLVCGFYGAPNLGDELMLHTLLDYLLQVKNLSITVMLSDNADYDIFQYSNIHFLHYPQTKFDFDLLSSYFDVVIFGGGALIDDSDYDISNYKMSLSTILIELTLAMISKSKKCYWVGLSCSNKIQNVRFISKLKFIEKNITYFTLRDTYSLDYLKKIGIQCRNINIIHDIILSNSKISDFKSEKKAKNNIGIILVNKESMLNKNLIVLRRLIKYLNDNNKPYKINLIPFYDYLETDTRYLESLAKKLDYDNIEVVRFSPSFNILDIINDQDFIISTRYHGSLLAACLNKPLFSIILDHPHYYNKMNYLYSKYIFTKNFIYANKLNEHTITDYIERLFSQKFKEFNRSFFSESELEIKQLINKIENE